MELEKEPWEEEKEERIGKENLEINNMTIQNRM